MSSKVSYVNEDLEDQEIQLSINDHRGSNSGLHHRKFHSQPTRPIGSARTGQSYYSEGEPSDENQTFWTKCLWYLKPSWNSTFVISCVIAVTLDPLFFYIPILDETKKCLHKDVQLKNYALVLRSTFDLAFIGHIVYLIRLAIRDARPEMDGLDDEQTAGNSTGYVKKFWDSLDNFDTIVEKLKWGSFMLDILCVLPIPQVLLVVVFYRMGDTGYLDRRKFLNFFLLIQYVVRIFRIYLSCDKLKRRSGVVAKGLFQFTLYIISGHIFGAFWYFFAIQRETSCWYRNCNTECRNDYSIYCGNKNITEATQKVIDNLSNVCASDSNFGFGIFKPALEFHYTGSKNFSKKLSFCFWWGLRNLSNYGTNLSDTSDYPWEILFAVLVSVSGLLIFLYLIGNVQTYMQNQAEKAKKEEIRQKMIKKAQNLKSWMSINHVPDNLKEVILQDIEERLEDNPDSDVDNLFSALSFETRKDLKRHLCMEALTGLPGLEGMDEKVVKMMCDYLKPVILSEEEVFAKEGDVADRMILISEGSMEVNSKSIGDGIRPAGKGSKVTLGKNDFYGHEQLLSWAAPGNLLDFKKLPTWSETVKCRTKVEGFALSAKDLQSMIRKCRFLWRSPNY